MTDFDKRQLQLMLKQIECFKTKKIDFVELTVRLEELYRALENIDRVWKKDFYVLSEDLDNIYAGAMSKNPDDPELAVSIPEKAYFNEVVDKIEQMLLEIFKEIPQEENYGTG